MDVSQSPLNASSKPAKQLFFTANLIRVFWDYSQVVFTCSKSTIETPEQCVKPIQS